MKGALCVLLISAVVQCRAQNAPTCQMSSQLRKEIHSYQPIVDQVRAAVIDGPYSGVLYNDLADYVDTFGYRQEGAGTLEPAIDNVIERQEQAGLEVSTHKVSVANWTRGETSAEVVQPRKQKLSILALGSTSSTPAEGITAEILMVKDFDELEARKDQVPGKIVLFNPEYVSYGTTGVYRNTGPARAAPLGAAAVFVRSITPFSIDSPHTGNTEFDNLDDAIPAASITLENANFIARLIEKGETVVVNFKSTSRNNPRVESRNVIGDIVGTTKPEEYVVISGHIDSWDVGQGAMDDGDGAFLAWHSLGLLKALGLPSPSRTLRAIMWTAEESKLEGSGAYRIDREDEARNWTIALESDGGVFETAGIGFAGTDGQWCVMQEIFSMFEGFNATQVVRQDSAGSDIGEFQDLGVPLGEPYTLRDDYFWYHHSNGDWMDVLRTQDLDQNLGIFASLVYILGNLSVSLTEVDDSLVVFYNSSNH